MSIIKENIRNDYINIQIPADKIETIQNAFMALNIVVKGLENEGIATSKEEKKAKFIEMSQRNSVGMSDEEFKKARVKEA